MKNEFLPVDAAYDRWSAFYDTYENPMVFMANHVVSQGEIARLAHGADVFEFGCGTGRNLAVLEAAGARSVAGRDFSDGMLAVARARNASWDLGVYNMLTPPVDRADSSADLVLFSLTLEHIGDLRLPLAEARRILRLGGTVAVIEIHPYLSRSGVAAHFDDGDVEVRMPVYAHQFGDYLNAFATCGLQVRACREWTPALAGHPLELAHMKNGPEFPLSVEFLLQASS
ncbi:methyltransferase [Bryobacterales bacterium F-183]|nr:methyltransferase [Bryobacterales bacterium F-183]